MKKVLLVDDDNIFQLLSTKTLERMGAVEDIRTAMNGKQALELFNNSDSAAVQLPDVILLDLNMPVMDGFGFLEAFGKLDLPNKSHVKIVILSSSINPADIKRAKDMGVSRYISKPITEHSLRAVLKD